MKKLLFQSVLAATVTLTWVAQATAGFENGIISVPEPGTLALFAAGAAAVTVGARWFRRK